MVLIFDAVIFSAIDLQALSIHRFLFVVLIFEPVVPSRH
jgi:hypothetical protein